MGGGSHGKRRWTAAIISACTCWSEVPDWTFWRPKGTEEWASRVGAPVVPLLALSNERKTKIGSPSGYDATQSILSAKDCAAEGSKKRERA
eukprot:scaffold11360_cov114-Isochrysis_galbana.AAC.10